MTMLSRVGNLRVGTKISAAFAVLVVLFGLVGGIALMQLYRFNNAVENITGNYLLGVEYLTDMRTSLAAYRVGLLRAMVLRDPSPEQRQKNDEALDRTLAKYDEARAKFEPTVVTDEERAIYREFQDAWGVYLPLANTLRGVLRDGRFDEAIAFYAAKLSPVAAAPETALQKDVIYNVEQGQEWTQRSAAAYHTGRLVDHRPAHRLRRHRDRQRPRADRQHRQAGARHDGGDAPPCREGHGGRDPLHGPRRRDRRDGGCGAGVQGEHGQGRPACRRAGSRARAEAAARRAA